jgi:hypothetical protein
MLTWVLIVTNFNLGFVTTLTHFNLGFATHLSLDCVTHFILDGFVTARQLTASSATYRYYCLCVPPRRCSAS